MDILEDNVDPMTVHDIFLKCNQSERWVYRQLPELTKTGLVVKNKKDTEDSKKPVTTYQFSLELNARAIPTWNKITRIMDDIYIKTVKTDKCVKCSNPSTEVEKVQNYICQALSNVSNDKERKKQLQQLTGLSNDANGEELTQMTQLTLYLRERDEKGYKKYYEEFIPTEEKSNQKTLNTSQNEDIFVKETNQEIDLSKYEMTVRRVEEILGSEKLQALQIARRMKKTSIQEIDFIEGILKQSVNDPSFETTLKVDPEGNYFNKNMEESNGK